MEEKETADFIVIGSGIAGLYTAIHLAERGRVAVISKQRFITGNTWYAQGGIAAALARDDSPGLHFEDTWEAGAYFGDRKAISILVEEAPARINDLITKGIQFDCSKGRVDLGQEGAHSRKRILHIGGDATGRELMETLLHYAKEKEILFIEDIFAAHLLMDGERCTGIGYIKDKRNKTLYGRAVILATGGCGQVFEYTTNAPGVTGDGLAMAYRAGAALQDMEFFQFHPTVYMPPGEAPFLISEAVRGEGAFLANCFGERFMKDCHPRAELGPRDVVARAILAEMKKTGRPVFLDMRHLGGDFIRKRFPTIFAGCKERGLNAARDLIAVSPAAHYLIGGVKVDIYGRTNIHNLYAVGEIASTGVHGANRLASNSLLEGLVFGYRVALTAAEEVKGSMPSSGKKAAPDKKAKLEMEARCRNIRPMLQQLMWNRAGLLRTEEGLTKVREQIKGWEDLLGYTYYDPELQETCNMLQLSYMMVEAALARNESRGSHYREDYPGAVGRYHNLHLLFQNGQLNYQESVK